MSLAPDPAVLAGLRKAIGGPLPLQKVGAKDGLFLAASAGKTSADAAKSAGWIAEVFERRATGRGANRKVADVSLGWVITETGRRHLLDADSPRHVLEAMLPVLERIADGLARPPADPGQAVRQATTACVEAINAAFAQLHATVESHFTQARQMLADVPTTVRPVIAEAMTRIEQSAVPAASAAPAAGFAALLPLLREVLQKAASPPPVTPPPAPAPVPHPQPPPAPTPAPPSAKASRDDLRRVIKAGYDELCLYSEFRSGNVEIPVLYDEAAQRAPSLSVEQFHNELNSLAGERVIQLGELNEVSQARRPELAINRGGRMLYYVIWR